MGKQRLMFILLFVILVTGMTSCAQKPESYSNAWIDYPRDGDRFTIGTSVTIVSHAFAREGVAEVVLSVNGEAYRRDVPSESGSDFVSAQQEWVPIEAGLYTLQVQAYDRSGNAGNPATISVEVLEEVIVSPTAVMTVTPVVTATEVVTVTPVPTATLVIIVTLPPPPATEPPPPPEPAADTTPPPVPNPAVPANGLELSCRLSQTLAWLPVDDPSGISSYYVKLEREVTAGNWQSAGGGTVSGKQVEVNVDCGGIYRWMVRAQDGAGNYSNWSAPSTFSVTLN